MLAYTYVERGKFALLEKPKPRILEEQDAIIRVTLASICASDLHIRQGSVPRAVPGVTVGHEMVGVVEETGPAVNKVRVGDRVAVNVETFCGECFFCQNGFVNNCSHPLGGWALGCRIDGGQAPYVRVPLANQGLNRIPESVSEMCIRDSALGEPPQAESAQPQTEAPSAGELISACLLFTSRCV